MVPSEVILIPTGRMVNLSRHEDDDPLIATTDLVGRVVKKHGKDAIEVEIPDIDPDRTFFIHQPEVGTQL
jgi:hypothetical protein